MLYDIIQYLYPQVHTGTKTIITTCTPPLFSSPLLFLLLHKTNKSNSSSSLFPPLSPLTQTYFHNVLRCTALAPTSSYSALLTHIVLNAAKDANIDPPVHVIILRLGGAEIRILTSVQLDACAKRRTSFNKRSPYPGNMVEPPANTICENNVFLKSIFEEKKIHCKIVSKIKKYENIHFNRVSTHIKKKKKKKKKKTQKKCDL